MNRPLVAALLFSALCLQAAPSDQVARATLSSKSGAPVATTTADAQGRLVFTGAKPGEYRLVLSNAEGRSVTLGDLDGDGVLDLIVGGALPGGAVISAREAAPGIAAGKRQHQPRNFLVDWSGSIKGGFATEAEAAEAGKRLAPSSAGRCAVKVSVDQQPGTIEIQCFTWTGGTRMAITEQGLPKKDTSAKKK